MSECSTCLFQGVYHSFWLLKPSEELAEVVCRLSPLRKLLASMPASEQGRSKQEDLEEFLWYAPSKGQLPKYPGQMGDMALLKRFLSQRLDQHARTVVSAPALCCDLWL